MPSVTSLFGREPETQVLARLLDRLPGQGGSLVVSGEPGVGKSALLLQASTRAAERGMLILTATASLPSRPDLVFMIALVARDDIYGELHKVSAQVTDNHHLDAIPKYEFIDAVDVDGDGRAELLFRLTSDAGNVFTVYSVIGDKLWPLFEGKPGT